MLELNKIYLGDCLEVMNDIPDGSVDAIITDPPYGTTACKWDSVIPFEPMWEQLKRIIKPKGAIVLFGSEPFSSALRLSNVSMYRYDIVWNKKKPSNFQMMNFQPGRIHEYIHVFSDKPAVFSKKGTMTYFPIKENIKPITRKKSFYGSRNSTLRKRHTIKDLGEKTSNSKNKYYSIVEFSNANTKSKVYPTQKPVSLLEYLIRTYTNEGETVLDFTIGSGTTAIAAIKTGRNFIGIEKDQSCFDLANKRIKDAMETS